MDTKEKKRPRASQKQRTASRRSAPSREERKRRSAQTRAEASARNRPSRVVRPPKEDIPEVVYTMPKPFRRNSFLLKLVTVAAVAIAMILCISLFFKVDTVMVAGMEQYTENQILEASGIEYGSSLLGLSKGTTVSRIRYDLPYVDEVKISIKLPGTVIIEVTELEAAYAVETVSGQWWLVSASGRAVEAITEAEAVDQPRILGIFIADPKADQTVVVDSGTVPTEETSGSTGETTEPTVSIPTEDESEERLAAALEVLTSLEANGGVGQMISLDVTDLSKVTMTYRDRFTVDLGSAQRLDYKVGYAITAIAQLRREGYDGGTLDMTLRYSEKPIFTPET